jgi:hypothetical protein
MNRVWRKLGVILAALILILAIAAVVLPKVLDPNSYHDELVTAAENALGGKVQLGKIAWGITHQLWLEVDAFSVVNATAFSGDITLTRLYASVSIPQLLSKKVLLKSLQLDSSSLTYRLVPAPEDQNSSSDSTAYSGVELPMAVEIGQLDIAIKRFELDDALSLPDRTLMHVFADANLSAADIIPGAPLNFSLSLRDTAANGLGALKAKGTFTGLSKTLTIVDPELKLHASLAGLDVQAIKPYLPDSAWQARLRGSIGLEVDYSGDLGENLTAQGTADLSRLSYTDTSRWTDPLPGQPTTLTFQLALDPDKLTAKKITLKLGTLSFAGQAVLNSWNNSPVLNDAQLSADLPVAGLAPLMPWQQLGDNAAMLRSALKGNGKVVVHKLTLPAISISRPPDSVNALLSALEMTAEVTDVSVELLPAILTIDGISGKLSLQNDELIVANVQSRFGPIALPVISLRAADLSTQLIIDAQAKGPLQLTAAEEAEVIKLVKEYGLKSLEVDATLDMTAHFDQRKPDDWTTSISLDVASMRAAAAAEDVTLDSLNGRIKFTRDKAMNVDAENLAAQINQMPVTLTGKVLNIGSPQMLISGKVKAEKIDLAHVAALVPALKELQLVGIVALDMDVHVPWATPRQSRLKGSISGRGLGFNIASPAAAIADGSLDVDLSGNSATIRRMTLQVNDQQLELTGRVANPPEPDIKLVLKSPALNFDQLLPKAAAAKAGEPPETTPAKQAGSLPPAARKLTATLDAAVASGEYAGVRFDQLNTTLIYKRGLVEKISASLTIDKGRFGVQGSADLRDLQRIPFTLEPDIRNLSLSSIAPALGVTEYSIHGAVTLNGKLQGHTGTTEELLGSLAGKLNASMGPGDITNVGRLGNFISKLASFASLDSLFSGRLGKDLADKGIAFREITAQATVAGGTLNLIALHFGSDAMNLDAQGTINLLEQSLAIDALLEPLAAVDSGFNYVPLVGKALADATKFRIEIKGPLEQPKIRTAETSQLGDTAKDIVEAPVQLLDKTGKKVEEIF